MQNEFDLSAFDYRLPPNRIAQRAVEPRDSSRLLAIRSSGELVDMVFSELPKLLRPDDLLVVNDTRVFPARLIGSRASGGVAEVFLLERIEGDEWTALVRPGRRLKPGSIVEISPELSVEVGDLLPEGCRRIRILHNGDIWDELERFGRTPLPLYIDRPADTEDKNRYQTIYSRERGAVAAPTAGLHFTERLFEEIRMRGIEIASVTLHVGWGTFSSIEAEDIRQHSMHSEFYEINRTTAELINSAIEAGRRIVAVGTTTVRALESAAQNGLPLSPISERTNLFIYHGFSFKLVGAIITNFHLPKSSLLVMISAFAGREKIMRAYEHAIVEGYRFYSYGDACFIE